MQQFERDATVVPAPVGGYLNLLNITANNHISPVENSVTDGGTKTLDILSASTQVFTGSLGQSIKLPTTGVLAGQTYTVINNSSAVSSLVYASDYSQVALVGLSRMMTFVAKIDTPVTAADWVYYWPMASQAATANTAALRDSNGNITSDAFIATATSSASAAGTTALTVDASGGAAWCSRWLPRRAGISRR